jgi:hypothetical protein
MAVEARAPRRRQAESPKQNRAEGYVPNGRRVRRRSGNKWLAEESSKQAQDEGDLVLPRELCDTHNSPGKRPLGEHPDGRQPLNDPPKERDHT